MPKIYGHRDVQYDEERFPLESEIEDRDPDIRGPFGGPGQIEEYREHLDGSRNDHGSYKDLEQLVVGPHTPSTV